MTAKDLWDRRDGRPARDGSNIEGAVRSGGVFGLYRNPVAHDPVSRRAVTDDELLELLTTLSTANRELDEIRRISPRVAE